MIFFVTATAIDGNDFKSNSHCVYRFTNTHFVLTVQILIFFVPLSLRIRSDCLLVFSLLLCKLLQLENIGQRKMKSLIDYKTKKSLSLFARWQGISFFFRVCRECCFSSRFLICCFVWYTGLNISLFPQVNQSKFAVHVLCVYWCHTKHVHVPVYEQGCAKCVSVTNVYAFSVQPRHAHHFSHIVYETNGAANAVAHWLSYALMRTKEIEFCVVVAVDFFFCPIFFSFALLHPALVVRCLFSRICVALYLTRTFAYTITHTFNFNLPRASRTKTAIYFFLDFCVSLLVLVLVRSSLCALANTLHCTCSMLFTFRFMCMCDWSLQQQQLQQYQERQRWRRRRRWWWQKRTR